MTIEAVHSSTSTSQSTKQPTRAGHPFDGLRALLIALVVAGHLNLFEWMAGGGGRVIMFFVISGFLITSILLKRYETRGSLGFRDFYYSRLARFAPSVVIVTILVMVSAFAFTHGWWNSASVHWSDMAWSLPSFWTQTVNVAMASEEVVPFALTPGWSLGIEWQFYLIWPVVMLIMLSYFGKRALMWTALVGAFASYAWSMWLVYFGDFAREEPDRIAFGTDTRGGSILLGCALAVAVTYPGVRQFFAKFAVPLVVVGVVGIAVMFTRNVFDFGLIMTSWGQVVLALLAALVVASLWVRPSAAGGLLTLAPLVWIGQRSLGIFLFHVPIMMMFGGTGEVDSPTDWGFTAVVLAVTLVVTGLSYRYLDQPLTRWAKARAKAGASKTQVQTPQTEPTAGSEIKTDVKELAVAKT